MSCLDIWKELWIIEMLFCSLVETISVLLSEMERYSALHERVKTELDHILDALDNLSNNLLSHSVVRPSVLKRMIEQVKQQLAEKYTNYELVITEVHDYYNIAVSSFDYVDECLFHYLLELICRNLCMYIMSKLYQFLII